MFTRSRPDRRVQVEVLLDFHGELLERGEVVVFWDDNDKHRVIVAADYREARELCRRILGRFRGGQNMWTNVQSALPRLIDPGRSLVARFGPHAIGLVRVWRRGDCDRESPVMICRLGGRTGREPMDTILLASKEHARTFVRRVAEHGVPARGWTLYEGEHQATSAEKLFTDGLGGVVVRTELEAELVSTFGQRGQARQALPPLEIPGLAPTASK